jgi:hypothetical protein
MAERWRRCSACKKDIALGGVYWVCSVSTCNRARTALVFCSVDCWEIHLPTERHREAWAVEARAPKVPDPPDAPVRMRTTTGHGPVHPPGASSTTAGAASKLPATPSPGTAGRARAAAGAAEPAELQSSPTDVLVVASKLKTYIREGSGFNTSDRVMLVLSDVLRRLCDEAMRNARRSGRDTVLDRDVPDRPYGG